MMSGGSDSLTARFVRNDAGDVMIEVTGVSAVNMDKEVTVTVTGLGTIRYNGNAFARAMESNSISQKQRNLGAALYNYRITAATYFAQKEETT